MTSSTSGAPAPEDASTRDRILDVALRSFAELGFDGSSTRAIAARAGVNQGLIPYYFGTKEALWREAVSRVFARLEVEVGGVLAAATDAPEPEQMARVLRRYVRFAAAHPEFVMMMNEEGKRDGERMRWLVDNRVRPLTEQMARFYETARERSALPEDLHVAHFHYVFVGVTAIFHQAAECRRLFGFDPSDPEIVERHADAVVQLFLGDAALGRDDRVSTGG